MTTCGIEAVKDRLAALSRKPIKSLGQNFLIDEAARDGMCSRCDLSGASVLEIGPGLGALTEGIFQAGAGKIIAVEKDGVFADYLSKEYAGDDRFTVINGDILRVDLDVISNALGGRLHVAGSLPYYITSPIILRLLESGLYITGMTLIMQQEASERFFAAPGDDEYGSLTVASRCMYRAERGVALPPSSFYPQPNVHSAAVHLDRKTDDIFAGFVGFLKTAFAMRRKTLVNNLLASGYGREYTEQTLNKMGIRTDARAESLDAGTLSELWKELSGKL